MRKLAALLLALALALCTGCSAATAQGGAQQPAVASSQASQVAGAPQIVPRAFSETTQFDGIIDQVASSADAGEYAEAPGVYVNGNLPAFTADDLAAAVGTEEYGALDRLGRCTAAFALVGPETEPTQKRGNISDIHPSGWRQAFYPELGIDHLYERSHLLAHCLTAEDANERNLITGTSYMNQGIMNTIEQQLDRYVDDTGNHLLLRVTPIFEGDDLVARGVQMEAYSLEDAGESICFNVYLYNAQPGVQIDYATGNSSREQAALADTGTTDAPAAEGAPSSEAAAPAAAASQGAPTHHQESAHHEETAAHHGQTCAYVLNTNTHKFHYPTCASVAKMKDKNKGYMEATRDEVIAAGYSPCGNCHP